MQAPPATAEVSSCIRGSVQLTLAPAGAETSELDREEDLGIELPFSTEPGTAVGVGPAFFATGLRHEARGAVALLGRIGDDQTVELIELGRVHGNVAPPRLAADGEDVVVALQQATAGGHDVRLTRLRGGVMTAPLGWRDAPHQTSDESNAFDLAAHGGRVLIVWDDWVADSNHGRVVAASVSFDLPEPDKVEVRVMSAPGLDAETPRITTRPGGYWLAWLVNPSVGAGAPRVYDPGGADDLTGAALPAAGARWVEVVPLDGEGRPEGRPRRLTPSGQRVVGYDLTRGADGAAWVVWRKDAPSSGAVGGRIFLAELRPDGTEEVMTVREDDVGAGEPSFLSAGAAASPWLTFPDAQDRTLLMRVDNPRALAAPLRLGRNIAGAAALAAIGQRILFAQPRGRAIELFPAFCTSPNTPSGSVARDAGAEGVRSAPVSTDTPLPAKPGEHQENP